MTTLHNSSVGSQTLHIPTVLVVGPVEWVEVHTRLYGIDSVGNVFVFKPPFSVPRHKALRHRGHFARRLYRAYLSGVRRAART